MRNTAATDLRAGGMDEADAMKITGHKTAHVFRHYDLARPRGAPPRAPRQRPALRAQQEKVMPLRGNEDASAEQGEQGRVRDGFCTRAVQQRHPLSACCAVD